MISYLDLRGINEPFVGCAERAARSGWYLKGDYTRRFEQAYADYTGVRHCVGCGNGFDALALIFRAYVGMGVMGPGDEVIVPANTYIASILAVTDNGLVPVLVEPDADTLQIDDRRMEQAVTARTRAVLLVHLYGRCAYTPLIGDFCRRHRLRLVEDNAQAHGCRFEGRPTGSLGDAAGHSFYPTKNLGALGDAGAVTTDDAELARTVEALGNYGSSAKYVFDHAGRNSRMDEIQAAVLLEKLKYLDGWNRRRQEIADLYINKVENPFIRIPVSARPSVWHVFPVFCAQRDALQAYLRANGVETQVHYPIPPHRQRCYAAMNGLSLPVTERLHAEELSIPCHQLLTSDEVERIADLLNRFVP